LSNISIRINFTEIENIEHLKIQIHQFKIKNNNFKNINVSNSAEKIIRSIKKSSDIYIKPIIDDEISFYLICDSSIKRSFKDFPDEIEKKSVVWIHSLIDAKNIPKFLMKLILASIVKKTLEKKGYIILDKRFYEVKYVDYQEYPVYFGEPLETENMLFYPGFQYKIDFLGNTYGIILDRIHLMVTIETVRNFIDKHPDKIHHLTGEKLWPCCPVYNCRFARGKCELSPVKTNGNFYFTKLINASPFDLKYNNKSIISYSAEKCLIRKNINGKEVTLIEENIQNKPPTIQVNKKYNYPAERLRRKKSLKDVYKKEERRKLSQYAQLDPVSRYNGIIKVLKQIETIEAFGKILKVNQDLTSYEKAGIINELKFRFHKKKSNDPIVGLNQDKPWDYQNRDFHSIHILFYYSDKSKITKKAAENFLKLLINGTDNSNDRFLGLEAMFNIKVEKTEVKKFSELSSNVKRGMYNVILAFPGEEEKSKLYKKAIQAEVPIQCVSTNKPKLFGKLRNVALGIYGNIGLQPWTIEKISENKLFVGIVRDYNLRCYSISVVVSSGKWVGGMLCKYSDANKEERAILLKNKILEFFRKASYQYSKENIVIHFRGNIELEEKIVLIELSDTILLISHSNIFRIFDDSPTRKPSNYSYVQTDSRTSFLITTSDITSVGTPRPIKIEIISPNKTLTEEMIADIAKLSMLHFGWDKGRSKDPITLTFATKALEQYREVECYPSGIYQKAWFL